jgi:Helix-turn-helix
MEMGTFAVDWHDSLAAGLILEWMDGHPSRNLSMLAKQTGIPKSEVSMIMSGKTPSLGNAIKLGAVLPADQVMGLLCDSHSEFRKIFLRFLSS